MNNRVTRKQQDAPVEACWPKLAMLDIQRLSTQLGCTKRRYGVGVRHILHCLPQAWKEAHLWAWSVEACRRR